MGWVPSGRRRAGRSRVRAYFSPNSLPDPPSHGPGGREFPPAWAALRERGVTQVVLTGLATSFGVESSARQADDLGYDAVLAVDGMTDPRAQQPCSHHEIEAICLLLCGIYATSMNSRGFYTLFTKTCGR